MKNISYIILGVLLFLSCTSNTIYEKPENLISKKKMTDILVDMYLAEGARSVQNKDLERLVEYMPLVYEKYQIDSVQFAESNFYYTSRIDDYEDIFKSVTNRLRIMKEEYDSIAKAEDSIKIKTLNKNKLSPIKPGLEEKRKRFYIEEEEEQ